MNKVQFKSRKDASKALAEKGIDTSDWDELKWLQLNKGQAEIHMMALAEAMWDAMNESTPKQLQAGEWHIPFEDKIDLIKLGSLAESTGYILDHDGSLDKNTEDNLCVKLSTAMAARTSYTVVGEEKEVSYETLIGIHDKMAVAKPFHASPFEHCARAMDDDEFEDFLKGEMEHRHSDYGVHAGGYSAVHGDMKGWCRNYRGFIQYRHILESQNS